jgi:DNA invertase Pin-like site-specific DNA recombinase
VGQHHDPPVLWAVSKPTGFETPSGSRLTSLFSASGTRIFNSPMIFKQEERPLIVGYARTSTVDQVHGLSSQMDELQEAGCEKVFSEQISSVAARQKLQQALDFVREQDVLVVTRLDRLARSVAHLWKIIETLQSKAVSLRILNLSLDTGTATGKLMLSMLGAVAEFEREMMLERQKEGIEKAKAAGKRFGRPTLAADVIEQILKMREQAVSVSEIAKRAEVSRSSIYRILKLQSGDCQS